MECELGHLLTDLCVKWGFCIPPDSYDQISKTSYYHADDFALDVLDAEGIDTKFGSEWVKKISNRFKIRFGCDEIDASTFVDRVRGEKEHW